MPEVRTRMSATVREVAVAVGDRVAAGHTILVVESMKMVLPVATDVGGRVAELRVAVGDDIHEGDVVAVVD